jgi:hypothetical protein
MIRRHRASVSRLAAGLVLRILLQLLLLSRILLLLSLKLLSPYYYRNYYYTIIIVAITDGIIGGIGNEPREN